MIDFLRIFTGGRKDNPEPSIRHDKCGRIYYPWYNLSQELPCRAPRIFNEKGQPLDLYFIRDRHGAHVPYPERPSHWLWDRYNFGLKTHFYTHGEMLRQMGRPDRKYGVLYESPAITPEDYEIFRRNPGLENDFDAVFTYDHRILESVPNARFVPFAAGPWYGTPESGCDLDAGLCEKKTKLISMVCSNKTQCELHRYRLQLAFDCKRLGTVDMFGTFDGGPFVSSMRDVLRDYRYSVMIENDITPYYFSERLTSCFAAMTVPIYCGAEKIGKFFNEEGIIKIRPGDDPAHILARCSEKDYEERLPAIRDNYLRVLEYFDMQEWIWQRYLKNTQ